MNNEQIQYMRDRFLGWTLPENLNPDGGIRFTRATLMPTGTNFLDATQAEAMVRYMIAGLPNATLTQTQRDITELLALIGRLLEMLPGDLNTLDEQLINEIATRHGIVNH